jgi:FMN reductase (NADPH)
MENGSMWYMNAITDSTIACTLLMSSANELGLGTCILGGFRRWPDGVNKLLNIKGKIAPALALCIGYKSKEGTNVPKINKCYDEHYDLKTVLKEASSYDEKMKKFYKKITNKEISWKEMVNKNLIKLAPYDSEKQIKRIFEIK